jgi:hypothetical protein
LFIPEKTGLEGNVVKLNYFVTGLIRSKEDLPYSEKEVKQAVTSLPLEMLNSASQQMHPSCPGLGVGEWKK